MTTFSTAHLAALWSVKGIGEKSFRRCLLTQKKSEITDADFWVNRERVWQKAALSQKQISSIQSFAKEHSFTSFYEQLLVSGIQVLSVRDKNYPPLLKLTNFAPSILFAKSNHSLTTNDWQSLIVAVVGTRRMTSYGQLVINTLLRDLIMTSEQKLKVVSGFMYGVDVTAMKLAHQLSQTIGILGYGFNFCFPRYQKALMQKMLAEGAIFLTEYPPSTAPSAGSFVQRNRIIAGLAKATIVIEAAKRSGSLITAQFALDANRPVLAVTGPITNPYSVGCQHLVNDGATLLAQAEDFWQLFADQKGGELDASKDNSLILNPKEKTIINLFREQGRALSLDQLLKSTQQSTQVLRQSLFNLEMKHLISQQGQNYILKS